MVEFKCLGLPHGSPEARIASLGNRVGEVQGRTGEGICGGRRPYDTIGGFQEHIGHTGLTLELDNNFSVKWDRYEPRCGRRKREQRQREGREGVIKISGDWGVSVGGDVLSREGSVSTSGLILRNAVATNCGRRVRNKVFQSDLSIETGSKVLVNHQH